MTHRPSSSKPHFTAYFSSKRVLIPVFLGLLVAVYMIAQDFSQPIYLETPMGEGTYVWKDLNGDQTKTSEELFLPQNGEQPHVNISYQRDILKTFLRHWTWSTTICLCLAMLMAMLRDFMYMCRIRLLTDKKLTWKESFQVIMLWEFGSAITPSVVGGSALAFFIVSLEGIPAGRSTAIVMSTALLDELFYLIVTPIVILIVGTQTAFATTASFAFLNSDFGVRLVFLIGYSFMFLLSLFILFSIFWYPKRSKQFLRYLGTRRMFRKWHAKFVKMGDDIITTSTELKGKSVWFWSKAYFYTLCSWTARFFVVNFLLLAVSPMREHFVVWARQLVMWVILCISPTPGSTGVAEFAFPIFLGEFIPEGMDAVLAVSWRIFTYYPYLVLGLIVLPLWTKRIIRRQREKKTNGELSAKR